MKKLSSVLVAAFCLATFFAGSPAPAGYGVGDAVTDFKLKNVDGKEVALSDFKSSKGVILIFDCNTCPYSKAYSKRIKALNEKYADAGYPVIAINSNSPEVSPGDSYEEMVKHANKHGYKFPYLFDETQNVATTFGATNTPHVFLLKNEGKAFKVAYIGAIDDNAKDETAVTKKYVEEAIDALSSGKTVETSKTKAIGCTIKWKDA